MTDPRGQRIEKPIDEPGKIAEFQLERRPAFQQLVSLNLEADELASYEVYLGVTDPDAPGRIKYFGNPPGGDSHRDYPKTDRIDDERQQSDRYVGVWVVESAPDGSTADLAVSTGQ